ncbi:MAG: acyl carrier protein [Defluviitaleaceae bacterium]|nr:acyl carrier protein [Defluviitaleaceae bacterium]
MEFETIRDVVAEQMEIDPGSITAETKFIDDLDADSLDLLQIIDTLQTVYGMEFANDATETIRTVGDAVDYVKKALGK